MTFACYAVNNIEVDNAWLQYHNRPDNNFPVVLVKKGVQFRGAAI
jgi:hypothetical protein